MEWGAGGRIYHNGIFECLLGSPALPPVTCVVHTFLWDYFKSLFPDDPTSSCDWQGRSLPRPQVAAALPSPSQAPFSVTSCVPNFPVQLQMPVWGCEIFHGLLLRYSSYIPAQRHSAQLDYVPSVLVPSPRPVVRAISTLHRTLLPSFNRLTVEEGSTLGTGEGNQGILT